jgi:hypothetical protein
VSASGQCGASERGRCFRRSLEWNEWRRALLYAAPIALAILGLFYYWFAVADRHVIFLYEHLGAAPFDEVTSGRYWMSGLVACGAVTLVYAGGNWLLGRVAARRGREYGPPSWWQVWVLCAPPLAVGIPIITMTLNWPTLPPPNATACVVATLIGLALALAPGAWAARRPLDLVWLVLDGVGLMPSLLFLRVIELPGRGLVSASTAYPVALGATFAGGVWLGLVIGLRGWRHRPRPMASAVFVAGLCLSYLLMPLVHHLLFAPPAYRYISASSNFFASSVGVQSLAFFVAVMLAVGSTRVRR